MIKSAGSIQISESRRCYIEDEFAFSAGMHMSPVVL